MLLQTSYLDQFKWKTLVKNSIDFGAAWQLFGTDFRPGSFDALFQVLSKCCDHSAMEYIQLV